MVERYYLITVVSVCWWASSHGKHFLSYFEALGSTFRLQFKSYLFCKTQTIYCYFTASHFRYFTEIFPSVGHLFCSPSKSCVCVCVCVCINFFCPNSYKASIWKFWIPYFFIRTPNDICCQYLWILIDT
jgi:hypothetical protein